MLLAIPVLKKAYVHHMDITGAFLYGDLSEKIYMRLPKRVDDLDGKVCNLKKSLYRLKQAQKIWHELLASVVIGLGFTKLQNAKCAYLKGSGDDTVYLLSYVDDMLIISKNMDKLSRFKKGIENKFKMTDLGEAKYS